MGALRAASILVGFAALTVPLMPVQALLNRAAPRAARRFPHWYHRKVCALLGVRLRIEGAIAPDQPVLIVSNHTSWLDIPVLSAVAPLSFVAKREVAGWPFVASLAKLQNTVFVDRERRSAVGATANEMLVRLEAGDTLVLFAEGTSSDGNRVLPFMTSLFAAAKPPSRLKARTPDAVVQPLSLVYTHLHGVPINRGERPLVGWYGDMEMTEHAWELLKAGPLDVTIRIGAPTPLDDYSDRKELARRSEIRVRENVLRILRGRGDEEPLVPATPPEMLRKAPPKSSKTGAKFV